MTQQQRYTPSPELVCDPFRRPREDNGEALVAQLVGQIADVTMQWESRLYRRPEGRGMQPDIHLEFTFCGRQMEIEITNSRSVWAGKKARMEAIEGRYRRPVLYINRQMLALLRNLPETDAVNVVHCWIMTVAFKREEAYGQLMTPWSLLQLVGAPEERRPPAKTRRKLQRRQLVAAAA